MIFAGRKAGNPNMLVKIILALFIFLAILLLFPKTIGEPSNTLYSIACKTVGKLPFGAFQESCKKFYEARAEDARTDLLSDKNTRMCYDRFNQMLRLLKDRNANPKFRYPKDEINIIFDSLNFEKYTEINAGNKGILTIYLSKFDSNPVFIGHFEGDSQLYVFLAPREDLDFENRQFNWENYIDFLYKDMQNRAVEYVHMGEEYIHNTMYQRLILDGKGCRTGFFSALFNFLKEGYELKFNEDTYGKCNFPITEAINNAQMLTETKYETEAKRTGCNYN